MPNSLPSGKWWLIAGYVCAIALAGVATAFYQNDSTRGYRYSYVQPDDQTFAIWSLIYTLLLCFAIYHLFLENDEAKECRNWMLLNLLSNGGWLFANGAANRGFSYWLSVFVLFLNLFSLYRCYSILKVDFTDSSSMAYKTFVYLPVSCNLAWVFLASVVCLSNTLYPMQNSDDVVAIGGPDWAIAVVFLSSMIACYLGFTYLDIGYAGIQIWALLGIHRNQGSAKSSPNVPSEELDIFALVCAGVVLTCFLCGCVSSCRNYKSAAKCKSEKLLTHANENVVYRSIEN